MPSTIRGSDNFDTAGGNAVKAWVNFNGTGTVAIRAAFNVSSITDNGTGDYTVNFTTALPDANYTANASAQVSGNVMIAVPNALSNPTTTAMRVVTVVSSGTSVDVTYCMVSIFR